MATPRNAAAFDLLLESDALKGLPARTIDRVFSVLEDLDLIAVPGCTLSFELGSMKWTASAPTVEEARAALVSLMRPPSSEQ